MKKMKLVFCISVFGCNTLYSAAQEVLARFDYCEQAVEKGDLEAFKESFRKDLLSKYTMRQFRDEPTKWQPITIAHLVVTQKTGATKSMLEHMMQLGFDPNKENFVLVQDAPQITQSGFPLINAAEYRVSPLPLDLAVFYANVPAIDALLNSGVSAYDTLKDHSFLKRWISRRCGENPLMHARAYAHRAQRGEQLPGTAEEYQYIVKMLDNAQFEEDKEECSIQ